VTHIACGCAATVIANGVYEIVETLVVDGTASA
jgi:hypothetical protein